MSPDAGWVKWTDPIEGAFTIDVPAGWQVTGGTLRPTPLTRAAFIQARAADGSGSDFYRGREDSEFRRAPELLMMAPPEGSWYSPGMMVMNFRTGEQYAREYGLKFFSWLSGQPASLAFSNPDPAAEMNFPRQGLLPGAFVSAGLAQFSIFSPQRPGVGVVSAVVIRNPMPGSIGALGMWAHKPSRRSRRRNDHADRRTDAAHARLVRVCGESGRRHAHRRDSAARTANPAGPAHAGAANADPAQIWRELQQAQTQAIQDETKNAQAAYDVANKAWDDVIKS